ncbi:DUF4376 domain-containing protein [Acinetobacter sp. A47]|uniref:DUF4376 domain-containing protein n=1 Tax=Acinetobacter sp. A47 TaxID=1561217 RepID=UPI000571B899|nr:DUF4376 domain-containing protein [Acinetobacter sp. A47]
MQLYLIKPNGQFGGRIEGTKLEVLEQVPPDYTSTLLPPPRETDYWNGSNWVNIGPAPSVYMVYDYDKKAWVDTRVLEDVQRSHWDSIKFQRNMAEYGGFTHDGIKYDSDLNSQCRINSALILGEPVQWTTADEGVVDFTVEEFRDLAKSMADHIQRVHAAGRVARAAIYDATTVAEVEAVKFFVG